MKKWDVKVLYLGKMTAPLSVMWPAGMPPLQNDYELSAPYLGFLLQCEGRRILVDTGINEKFIVGGRAWAGLPAEGGAAFVEKALEEVKLTPKDIETVVLTHLHNDHAGNCHLFPDARIVFQKDEWLNLLNPIPQQLVRMDYDMSLIEYLRSPSVNKAMAQGDIDLDDGVALYKVPGGHSLGSQVVAVNTEKGRVVLMGDISLCNYMAFPGTTEIVGMDGTRYRIPPAPKTIGPAVPHGIIYDLFAFNDGINKIKTIASRYEPGYVLPGHEPSLIFTGV